MSSAQPSLWRRAVARIQNFVRPDDPIWFQQWVNFPDQPSGVIITPDTALEISTVWACVTVVSNAIATAPWHVVSSGGDRLVEDDDDPLSYLLNVRPNDDMTATAFREAMMFGALTWGNSYAEIGKNALGEALRLWPLLPSRVMPRREAEPPYLLYYEYRQMDGGVVRLEQSQVYHLKGPGISGLMGDNLTARAAKSMGLAAAADRFASTFFGNNTVIGGVLEFPGKLPRDKDGRPDATIDRLRSDWAALHAGPNKAHKPAVLENGMTWKPFQTNAGEAQLLEARKFSVEEICRWFGVPGHLVGNAASSQGYGRNLEEMGIAFARHALRPWAKRLELEADYKLLGVRAAARRGVSKPGRRTQLDFTELQRPDAMTEAKTNEVRLRNGVITINDWLTAEKRNVIDAKEGDVRLMGAGVQTLDIVLNPPEPQAPQPGPAAPAAGDGEADKPKPDDKATARSALVLLLTSSFDRYRRRLQNRETDLRRNGASPDKIAAHMIDERVKLRPWLLDDVSQARALANQLGVALGDKVILGGADEIDAGTEPAVAAWRIVAYREDQAREHGRFAEEGGGDAGAGGGKAGGEKSAPEHDPATFSGSAYADAARSSTPTPSEEELLTKLSPVERARYDALTAEVKTAVKNGQETHLLRTVNGDGKTWTPEAKAEHDKILGALFADSAHTRPPAGEKPTVILLGGRGGSGKSQFSEDGSPSQVFDKSKFVKLDADEIKSKLTGYDPGKAYLFHEESSYVFKAAVAEARRRGLNVVLDITMGSSLDKYVQPFREAGYNIEAHYMHLPEAKAAARALDRWAKPSKGAAMTGRLVPPSVVLGMKDNERHFDAVKSKVDKWSFWTNDVPRGSSPHRVSHSG